MFAARALALDYSATLANNYHAQENSFYCGPATAQMILDATNQGNIVVSQSSLFTTIENNQNKSTNSDTGDGLFWTTPTGMQAALQMSDTNAGHNYVVYNEPNYDKAIKTLAFDIDHYGISAAAMIGGYVNNRYIGGAHWVNVYGVATNIKPPSGGGDFVVQGFYINDPARKGAFGKNSYVANNRNGTGWQDCFIPVDYGIGGKFRDNYAFVADPDPGESTDSAEPTAGTTSVTSPSRALTQAAADLGQISGLANDPSFENGGFSSSGEEEITLAVGGQDWLVPYVENGQTTGVALIDPVTGDLDQALWDEGVLSGDSLSALETYLQNGPVGDNVAPEPSSWVLLAAGGCLMLGLRRIHSTVTLLARFRGLSMSQPRATAM
jgi:hypothetical protein